MDEAYIVFITAKDEAQADAIASALVEERLAACVNIVPGVRSIYRWKGEICDDTETLAVIKTEAQRFDAMKARLVELHPYEVAEVIAMPVEAGHAPYLDWIASETKP